MAPSNRENKNRLLASLPREDMKQFFAHLHSVDLEQKDIVCEIGSPIEHVYFMEEGIASVMTTMTDGASIEVGMIGFEGMVGIPALLGSDISPQQVVIQLPGKALRMPAAACKAAFDQSANIRRVFYRFIESFLNLSAQSAACNRLHSVEQRCGRWLLMSSDRVQSDILPLTQEYLAIMLGVRRAGVSDVAGELQRSGLIRYHHGEITIVDRDGLAALACECYRFDRDRFNRLLKG